jgi:Flp pilus assembly protein TadG
MRFLRDTRGTSAIEFAAAATLLIALLTNALDFNDYEYRSMQVADAAQVGAQNAWKKCNSASSLPATQNCSGLNATVTTAIQSTALGSRVSLVPGYPEEG